MTVEIGPNLATVLVGLVAAIPGLLAAYYARKATGIATSTHELVNSQSQLLLKATASEAKAEGVEQERERTRQDGKSS